MKKDRITGISLGFVSVLFLYMTWALPSTKNGTAVGPKVFPYGAAGGLLLCSIALILKRGDSRDKGEPFLDAQGWLRVAKLLCLLVLFPILLHFIGFPAASLTFLLLMISLFDLDREVPLWKRAAVSLAVTAVLFAIFSYILKIQLPKGLAFDFIRG